jgi:hypothetical protein
MELLSSPRKKEKQVSQKSNSAAILELNAPLIRTTNIYLAPRRNMLI